MVRVGSQSNPKSNGVTVCVVNGDSGEIHVLKQASCKSETTNGQMNGSSKPTKSSSSNSILYCSNQLYSVPLSALSDRHDSSSLLQAKHRASILWLLSKAFDNRIPLEIQDPYYKDHEGEDCLKPFIVQGLASAELYCLALSHIYQDHQYSNLSHQQIMTHLMRRGIYIQDPQDTSLTESVLIQTAPIKMVS